ncbi:MAG TPA: phosphoribosylanthranilate isomerase [Mucilaginibacter sp.]|jgi:phosphoribosylanthranilate isomerase
MKIKVCGLKDPENIKAVAALSPDYMGFIFYGPSPRFIDKLATESMNNIPPDIKKTAVFVNENAEAINVLIDKHGFDAIQLHGDESPGFCNSFGNRVTIFKAFGLDNNFDFTRLNDYVNKVDFFLFDAKTDIYGGSGKTFDWSVLNQYKLEIPFFLSGGISLDNLEEVKNTSHPQFYGVDLNSKFEDAPGLKNINKLEKAFDIIKQTQYK